MLLPQPCAALCGGVFRWDGICKGTGKETDLVDRIRAATDLSQYEGIKKVVLAYSGGLDTSVIVRLIQEVLGAEVVTVSLGFGQAEYAGSDMSALKKKALSLGAKSHIFFDVREEFFSGYISKAIKANSLYQGEYPNSTALGRPLIAKYLVNVAEHEGADTVAHGSTGKGNDQVRFDLSIAALNPELKIIAPVRDWGLKRDEEIAWASEKGIPVPASSSKPYSVDANMWGRSSECGILEDPSEEAPEDVFEWVTPPEKAPDAPAKVKLWFKKGIPATLELDGMKITGGVNIITVLNEIAGKNGVGIIDHMEDRVVGLKSREVYECPAATVILKAHKDLEKYVFTKEENGFKPVIDKLWSECVYGGFWYHPLMKELNAFIDASQGRVSGWVALKLYKGTAQVLARDSPNALYDLNLATYNAGSTYNQKDALGFIKLYGLNTVMAGKIAKAQAEMKVEA